MTNRVGFPFVGDNVGGSHVSAALLMRDLPGQGFAPVALVHRRGLLSDWLEGRGLSVLYTNLPFLPPGTGGLSAVARLAAISPRLVRFLRQQRLNLLHTNDGRTALTWLPACRLAGVKTVAHQRTRWYPSTGALDDADGRCGYRDLKLCSRQLACRFAAANFNYCQSVRLRCASARKGTRPCPAIERYDRTCRCVCRNVAAAKTPATFSVPLP